MALNNSKDSGFAHWIALVAVLVIIVAIGVLGFHQFQKATGFGVKVDVNNPPNLSRQTLLIYQKFIAFQNIDQVRGMIFLVTAKHVAV